MKIIGVTGGVGAGKSTVLDYLRDVYHAEVIQADLVGHEVMEPGMPAYDQVRETFGQNVIGEDGKIDRKILGSIVFGDDRKREQLNGIIHPAVGKEILHRMQEAEKAKVPCLVLEAALLLEENYDAFCDETWYIYTNEANRRRRLKESRGYTEERITQIFRSQKTHEEFQSRCQYQIDNNGSREDTWKQIDKRMRT